MKGRILALLIVIALVSGISAAVPVNLSILINDGDSYTASAAVDIEISADSATGTTECRFTNEADIFNWSETESFPSLPSSTTWTLYLLSGNGERTVNCQCISQGENWSEAAWAEDYIILDTALPSIGSLSPANGSISTSLKPTISAELSDSGSGINSSATVFKFDGSVVNSTYSAGTVSYTPPSNLSESVHTVEITAYDNMGNSTTAAWDFTVDPLPVIDEVDPSEDSYIKSTSFTIYAEVSDSTGINESASHLRVDGSKVDTTYSSGRLEYSGTFDEGKHTAEAWAYDLSGSLVKKSWSFVVDKTEPAITNLVPGDKSTVAVVSGISARISDEHSGIDEDSLMMELDGVDVTSDAEFYSNVLSFRLSVIGGGEHSVEIWADDKAGNSGYRYWTFTLSKNEPLIDQLTPQDGSSTNSLRPVISARLTDNSGTGLDLNSPKIYLDGTDFTSIADYDNSKRILSYTPDSDLAEGEHTAKVKVSDNAKSSADKTWKLTVDNTPPSKPSNLKVSVSGSRATLSWTAPQGAASYKIYRSSSKIASVSGMSPAATIAKTAYNDTKASGKMYYAVTAVDAAGNEGAPAYGGTCAEYDGGWRDYACCADADCGSAKCNMTTHACYYPEVNASMNKAQDAIDEANASIIAAEDEGKNVTEAQDLLDQALNSFRIGNYAQAEQFADQARLKLQSAPTLNQTGNGEPDTGDGKKPLPCCAPAFILLGILSSGIYYWSRSPASRV